MVLKQHVILAPLLFFRQPQSTTTTLLSPASISAWLVAMLGNTQTEDGTLVAALVSNIDAVKPRRRTHRGSRGGRNRSRRNVDRDVTLMTVDVGTVQGVDTQGGGKMFVERKPYQNNTRSHLTDGCSNDDLNGSCGPAISGTDVPPTTMMNDQSQAIKVSEGIALLTNDTSEYGLEYMPRYMSSKILEVCWIKCGLRVQVTRFTKTSEDYIDNSLQQRA